MSSSEDNVLIDPNGNTVEVEATATTTGFFANILKKVWPSRDLSKYELKYRTRKASDGAKSDTSSIWSKITGFLAQEHTNTVSGSGNTSVTSSPPDPSSPRDSMMATSPDEAPPTTIQNSATPRASTSSSFSTASSTTNKSTASSTRKSFSEEFKGVRTRKEVLFSKEYRKRRSRNLNELYSTREQNDNVCNGNWNRNINSTQGQGGGGDVVNRVSLIVTSPSGEDVRIDNLNEINSRTDRQNYNVNELDMGFMYRSGMESDVAISCQGQIFRAHSFVLKAQSGHFRRILFMKSDTKPIVINQLLPGDMEALLLYMYTGRIAKNYCTIHGELTERFEIMLEDFDVPFPDGTQPLCE